MSLKPQPLVYKPARRGNVACLIMIAGPSGSGKTKSALRLARGMAGPDGLIGLADTEHGRALYYAPAPGEVAQGPHTFDFQHLEMNEPFNPAKFEEAAVRSQGLGHLVWVCDSFSHEHTGPGGVLDMQEEILQRMAGDNFEKREQMKYASWIKPKAQHKHLVQRLWQLNAHIIICCHAERKLDLIKNDKGKMVPNPERSFSPVCAPDIPYAMTVSFLLDARQPGVPTYLKRFDKLEPLIALDRPLDEETGAAIARWSRGEPQPGQAHRGQAQADRAQADRATARKPVVASTGPARKTDPDPGAARATTGEPDKQTVPGTADAGASDTGPPQAGQEQSDRSGAITADLVAAYNATTSTAEHFALVDHPTRKSQVQWLRKHRPALFDQVNAAIIASYQRLQTPSPPKTDAAPTQGALV